MPTKAERKRIDGAVSVFHSHYASPANWGSERWTSTLYPALTRPTRYAALVNGFAERTQVDRVLAENDAAPNDLVQLQLPRSGVREDGDQCAAITLLEHSFHTGGNDQVSDATPTKAQNTSFLFAPPTPVPSTADPTRRVFSHWNLDAASVLAAHMLDVQPGDRVLDLCAAPGGKSVTLAQKLFCSPTSPASAAATKTTSRGCLHSNEIDAARNKRLAINLQSYLPRHLFETGSVRVLRLDAADARAVYNLPLGVGGYDRVLLDAPCSSERHIIHAHVKAEASGRIAEEMTRWRPGSSRNMAKLQAELLMTALRAVRVGGRVVYSTCSIETGENDGVVEKVLVAIEQQRKKAGLDWGIRLETALGNVSTLDEDGLDRWTERTRYGRIALPDHPGGGQWGPLFFTVITKVAVHQEISQ